MYSPLNPGLRTEGEGGRQKQARVAESATQPCGAGREREKIEGERLGHAVPRGRAEQRAGGGAAPARVPEAASEPAAATRPPPPRWSRDRCVPAAVRGEDCVRITC